MGAYKALGADKGQQIQGVLTSMGYQNINDVKPEHYAQLHAGVEALKA
jgi:phosphoribosylformylglycinamidine (FGAM) synthase PurS component